MAEPEIRHVPMPPSEKYPNGHTLPLKDRVLVVIGANGSGKTRFGAWLDLVNIDLHHRVGAHRSLGFPDRIQPTDLKEAERHLFFGHPTDINPQHNRRTHRWKQNPAVAMLDDFTPLEHFTYRYAVDSDPGDVPRSV